MAPLPTRATRAERGTKVIIKALLLSTSPLSHSTPRSSRSEMRRYTISDIYQRPARASSPPLGLQSYVTQWVGGVGSAERPGEATTDKPRELTHAALSVAHACLPCVAELSTTALLNSKRRCVPPPYLLTTDTRASAATPHCNPTVIEHEPRACLHWCTAYRGSVSDPWTCLLVACDRSIKSGLLAPCEHGRRALRNGAIQDEY